MQAKVGDTVRFLNAVGGGTVVRIDGQMAYVDDDGFETPVLLRECVPVASDKYFKNPEPAAVPTPSAAAAKAQTKSSDPEPADELPFVETPAGELLNIMLGFEPRDIRHLSSGEIDAYLVNDSNYYLYFTLLSRENDSTAWTVRYAGMVEPGIQLLCGEFEHDDLPRLEQLAVQYIAFKKTAPFAIKEPASVVWRVDTTKFAKLHCYKPNTYFESPVIAFDVTVDDKIQKAQPKPDPEQLRRAMSSKAAADRPKARPVKKQSKTDTTVVDLHASALLDDQRGLTAADILNYQVDHFRRVMDEHLRNFGHKIVFIHGKGDGVLRQALLKELTHRYKGHDVQDASFREYGYGATQVTIRQHLK